jgi:sialic acid synthase SpsE
MNYAKEFKIGSRMISQTASTYFIADIAANHDGNLCRALDLISQAKEAGADCAKFQHFTANTIVSEIGFEKDKNSLSHQKSWNKSVVEVYDQYHTKAEWDLKLVEKCREVEIDFMTTPYNVEAITRLDANLKAYKIGSGDITNYEIIQTIAQKQKPVFLATGASSAEDVRAAMELIIKNNKQVCLMQCNTNYTGSLENFKYINLNVIKSFSMMYPGLPLGLSDHTPGHTTVLGAIALGSRVVEKHFTDDCSRVGPDHKFAMDPITWRAMVTASRELENALGDGIKRVEHNELETVIIQRRSCRLKLDKKAGDIITQDDIEFLRPCEKHALTPLNYSHLQKIKINKDLNAGESLKWADLET